MNNKDYIKLLEDIPSEGKNCDLKSLVRDVERMKKDNFAIEVGIATEIAALYAFNKINIDDGIFEAYSGQYPNLSESQGLYSKILEEYEDGDLDLQGLVSGIKGKFFEINVQKSLENTYPDWNFSIAESANQPVWDIKGVGNEGQELLIQVKTGGVSYASEVKANMLENPDVMFATTTEIKEKIIEESPELASQFIDIGVDLSNLELTEEITSSFELLRENMGIDFPDELADILPYAGEIIAGIKLLVELSQVSKDYSEVEISEQRKIQGLRAIMAFSRFGVTSVIIACGSVVGSIVLPGIGTFILGTSSALASIYINNKIKPHLFEPALFLMNLTQDDMFYYKNKSTIDEIGQELRETRLTLQGTFLLEEKTSANKM